MDAAKIRLSPEEVALVTRADWILTKNRVMQKAMTLLGLVQVEQKKFLGTLQNSLPQTVNLSSPKISRGENYQGLPWLMLDYPRVFDKENTFAIRTFFWWGNFFSVTLHLSGSYKTTYGEAAGKAYERFKTNGFFICVNTDQWQHHFETDNYRSADQLDVTTWQAAMAGKDFIKLAKKISLHDWLEAREKLLEAFRELVLAIQD